MPDLAEQICALIDTVAAPVTSDEIRARARSRRRRPSRGTIGAGALLVAATVIAFGLVARSTGRSPRVVTQGSTTSTASTAPAASPAIGSMIGTLDIGAIGVHLGVLEGIDAANLRRGPGHDPLSPLPGAPGDTVIWGHSTIYSHPFRHLNELREGDTISLTRSGDRFEYTVTQARRVDPRDLDRTIHDSNASLTLVTFAPLGSKQQRLVVSARSTGHIAAHIELPSSSVIGGDVVHATLVVDNETGAPITLIGPNGCAERFAVVLGNDQIPPTASFVKICGAAVVVRKGRNRLPLTVITTYPGCTTIGAPWATVGCAALPPGSYRATLVGDTKQIPVPRAPVVKVLSRP